MSPGFGYFTNSFCLLSQELGLHSHDYVHRTGKIRDKAVLLPVRNFHSGLHFRDYVCDASDTRLRTYSQHHLLYQIISKFQACFRGTDVPYGQIPHIVVLYSKQGRRSSNYELDSFE